MNLVKKAVTTFGCIFLAALLLTALAPKATRAIVAALVQDVDNPGRATLATPSCTAQNTGSGAFSCDLASGGTTYTVPSGYRFVIDQVSGDCTTPSNNTVNGTLFALTEQETPIRVPFVMTSQGTEGEAIVAALKTEFTFNQSVRYYADPGSTLQIGALTTDTSAATRCQFRVSGHLISYP
jgi:hypothetical protein